MYNKETLENKINMDKIRDIKLMLRRRYSSRINYRKLFKEWNKSVTGEIDLYEAHQMINSFVIPLNFNETKVLIATSNKRGNDALNLEEFIEFINPNDTNVNIDLNKMTCKLLD